MSKKWILPAFLFWAMVLFVFSCKKDDPEPECCNDTSFASMKNWCYFKEGSWWVYEEQNSGDRDTVTVHESLLDNSAEAFQHRAYSTWYDNDFVYIHNPNYIGGSNVSSCEIRRLHRTQSSSGNFIGGGLVANFPPLKGEFSNDQGGQVSSGVQTLSIDSSIVLSPLSFESALYFTIGIAGSEDFQPLNLFFVRNIGIVRKELPTEDKYWNLIDYHIIQ